MHALFESAVKGSLNEGANVNTDVLDCLLADSLKGSGREGAVLYDGQTEESLEALEEENKEIRVLQQILRLPRFQVNEVLRPAVRRSLAAHTGHDAGQGQHGHAAADLEASAGLQTSLKGAEIIKRWN
jgi:hypothetical protein